MNISRGENWGRFQSMPDNGLIIYSNKELFEEINRCKRKGEILPVFGLLGGDLWRTLGGSSHESRLYSKEATFLEIDLGCVLLDGKIFWFSSHVFVGEKLANEQVLISNVAHYGKMNVAPKAHPGDGKLDVLKINLSVTQKIKALKRSASGDHLPHPRIKYERVKAAQLDLGKKKSVEIDGQKIGKFSDISFILEEQALSVIV